MPTRAARAKEDICFRRGTPVVRAARASSRPLRSCSASTVRKGCAKGATVWVVLYTFVPELLIPDEKLSVRKGAIVLLGQWADMGRYRRHIYKGVADAIDKHLELKPGTML